jgi:predicted transcriptional regulator
MTEIDRLYSLVDTLLDGPTSNLWSIKDAVVDDEPLTTKDEQALVESERDLAEGRVVSHAEARRRLLPVRIDDDKH